MLEMRYTYYITPGAAARLAKKRIPRKHRKTDLATFLRDNNGLHLDPQATDPILYFDADTGFRVEHGEWAESVPDRIGMNPAMVKSIVIEGSSRGYPAGTHTRDRMKVVIEGGRMRLEAEYWHLVHGKAMAFLFSLLGGQR